MSTYASRTTHQTLTLILASVLLSACQPKPAPVDQNAAMTQAVGTAFASIQQTKAAAFTPTPADTPTPLPTVVRTPPALPPTFVASSLNPLDTPHTYVQDQCQYLKNKWTSTNSAPGTVVMVIMIHGITTDTITAPDAINVNNFNQLMNDIHSMGFQTINTQQLVDFLYTNAKIPQRSVLLIMDDRRTGSAIDHVYPFLVQYNWTLTLAWLIGAGPDSTDNKLPLTTIYDQQHGLKFQTLWQQVEAYYQLGHFDVQAHGFVHNIPISSNSSEEYIHGEIYNPIPILEQHFGKQPIAFIWPGGGFTLRAVQVAREAGYKVGFTINPRGPIMFNWVPQGDQADPQRPYYLPEGPIKDPLMLLPRYWDVDAGAHLDEVRIIGNQAAAYAQQNKATELEYYDIMCKPTLGPIP